MPLSPLETKRRACLNPPAQPSADWLRDAGQQVMGAMLDDFLRLGGLSIGHTATRAEMEDLLREPPPEAGIDFTDLLGEFHAKVVQYSYRPNHPRFLAFIPSAPTFVSILGDCLASSANLFAGVWKEAAGPAQVEIVVLDWFKEWLGYPPEAAGLFTSGGSEANLTALVVARESISHADRPRLVLYASEQRHWSIDRAAKIIGLAPEQIRPLACDTDYRLQMDALSAAVAEDEWAGRIPWVVIANAGTTNTGSVDPLGELADFCVPFGARAPSEGVGASPSLGARAPKCTQRKLWLHVDAAYGWPMALTGEGRGLLKGIARADSITLDPHKWFAQPFEAGCLLVRRGELLQQTFMMRPEYMQDVVPRHDEINFCDQGIALTRRFRALKIWFSLKLLGVSWFRRLMEHDCALAEYAQALLAQTGRFEITSKRKLSIICFRYVPRRALPLDALQQAIADELARSGQAFLSTTRLDGRTTLRFCFTNWRTTAQDVEAIVAILAEIGARLEKG
jgi:glutamate/tyrosine decarboxylase-like PLP-dependent enzyme